MYGDQSFTFLKLFGTRVQTNVEALAIIGATWFGGSTWLEGLLIVASFAVGTGLHLGCHWAVAIAYGKGIDNMVLTRAGRIDYSGEKPAFFEEVLRTSAGPTMNAVLAGASYAALTWLDTSAWPPLLTQTVAIFGGCNLILTAINYLPAIPFDGGLIVQAFLRRSLGAERALRIATYVSLVLLVGVAALGVWQVQPVLVYLALTIGYDNWRKHLRAPREAEA